jgi:hypothetical protein
MPTNHEIEMMAQELARRSGRTWEGMNPASKYKYYQAALTKLSSATVVFPMNIKPTYCTVVSSSRLLKTRHGTVRVTLQLPARSFYVCRTSEGDRVYPGISMGFADQPCGPECVNR